MHKLFIIEPLTAHSWVFPWRLLSPPAESPGLMAVCWTLGHLTCLYHSIISWITKTKSVWIHSY